jgi:preprotein translocase subunit SecB
MILQLKEEEIQAAFPLQQNCELRKVTLLRCSASIEEHAEPLKGPFSLHLSHDSTEKSVAQGMFRVEVQFKALGRDSSEPPKLHFTLECSFGLDYAITDKSFQPTSESIAAFKSGNAVYNCWPYAREFIQNTTERMALDLPPLPFLRVAQKSKPKEPKGHVEGIPAKPVDTLTSGHEQRTRKVDEKEPSQA